jgi:hypothetical protein
VIENSYFFSYQWQCDNIAKELYWLVAHCKCNLFFAGKHVYFEQETRTLSISSIRKALLKRTVTGHCLSPPQAKQGEMGLDFSITGFN